MVLQNKNQHTDFYAAVTPLGLPPDSNLKCLTIPLMNLSIGRFVCIREAMILKAWGLIVVFINFRLDDRAGLPELHSV